MNHHGSRFCGAVPRPARPGAPAPGETTTGLAVIPAAAWRAFARFAGRRLARRTSRYLRTIDPRDLDAIMREARAFADLMQALRARVHRCARRVRNARLADARR